MRTVFIAILVAASAWGASIPNPNDGPGEPV